MADLTTDELIATVAEALRIEPARLTLDSRREDVPEWDSLGHVMAMMAVETRFGVQLSLEQLDGLKSIRQLKDILDGLGRRG